MTNSSTIYLDYAAATPVDMAVEAAMRPFLSERFFNPSAAYNAGRGIKKELATTRGRVAHWLGCKPAEIVFTAGVTESVNLALKGIVQQGGTVLVGATEHEAVLEAARHFTFHREIPVDQQGVIRLDELASMIDDEVVLISVMYANNETGTVQPLKEIARYIEIARVDRRKRGVQRPLLLHSDAAQAANYLDLHVSRLGVDLMSLSGAKMYGPKQTGALYVRGGIELEPIIRGGGQERGLRAGTENVAGVVGLATALEVAQAQRRDESKRLQDLRNELVGGITNIRSDAVFNGSSAHCLPNIVNFSLPGMDGERLVQEFDERGIMIATGAACSAASDEPSHVLLSMGVSPSNARGSLRVSMGRPTTSEHTQQFIQTLNQLV